MPHGSTPHWVRHRLGVPADAAWNILTSPAGARRWLADESHQGICVGARVPLRGSGPAEIVAIGPEAAMELAFPSGRRAVLQVRARAPGSEITVADYGVDGQATEALDGVWQALLAQAEYVIAQVKASRRGCQAIVVIHSVGGQGPLSAIKSFTDALIPRSERYSKPDNLSKSYELRRYQLRRAQNRPRTDLFELYWADKVPGTKLGHILAWLRSIAFRRPRDVSDRLRPIAYLIRVVAAVTAIAIILLLVQLGTSGLDQLWHGASALARVAWIGTGISLLGGIVSGLLVGSLGNAARYPDPAPDNIAVRQSIRQSGIELLHRLHADQQYDRIVVVGIALGSVIGYDMIRLYWSQVHKSHGARVDVDQTQLQSYEKLAAKRAASAGRVTTAQLDEYRKAQRDLWREYRRHGLPWLITDLVTIGSPLTHAGTLLARSPADLEDIIEDRELPTCPPRVHREELTQRVTYLAAGQIRTLKMLTFNAPFAVTRWTNIYAPNKAIIFGDPIGGPVAPVFGDGIKDIAVKISPWWRRYTPLAHVSYLRPPHSGNTAATDVIKESLGIDSGRWLKKHVDEMPWEASISTRRTDEPS